MAKKETTTTKKAAAKVAEPAKEKEVVIETIPVPEEILNTDVEIPTEQSEDTKKAEEAMEAVKESQEKVDEVLKNSEGKDVRATLEEELKKMEDLKKDLTERINSAPKRTTIWNGINFNF